MHTTLSGCLVGETMKFSPYTAASAIPVATAMCVRKFGVNPSRQVSGRHTGHRLRPVSRAAPSASSAIPPPRGERDAAHGDGKQIADDSGYDFLVANGKNPWGMVQAFEKFQQMEGGDGQSSYMQKMFSSHPETAKRIKRMSERATKDGYTRPAAE